MYQGIANNFMFEVLEDAEVCLWEEALFAQEHQETIKLIMEGAETAVGAKYRKNVQISRVPLGITCNVMPWVTIPAVAHQKAFKNRAFIFKCHQMPQLKDYADKGRINPRAWLYVDPQYWASQTANIKEESEEEDYFSDSGDKTIASVPDSDICAATGQQLRIRAAAKQHCEEHNRFVTEEDYEQWFTNLPFETQPFYDPVEEDSD